jgi:hypothetical protein
MTDETKEKVKEAKAPTWKKVLIWVFVVLGLLIGITVLLVMLFRKKGPASAVAEVINFAKTQNAKADMDAKIAIAKAEAVEEETVKQLEQIKEIKNEEERAKRLAELL